MVCSVTVQHAQPAPVTYTPQALVSQICGVVFSKVVTTAVNRLFIPDPKVSELRDEMLNVIDESEPKVKALQAKKATSVTADANTPKFDQRIDRSNNAVDYIEASLNALNQAKRATRCGVCQREIDAAAQEVAKHMSVIQNSDKIYRVMKDLEARGELPRGVSWNALKETERERVRKMVREYDRK